MSLSRRRSSSTALAVAVLTLCGTINTVSSFTCIHRQSVVPKQANRSPSLPHFMASDKDGDGGFFGNLKNKFNFLGEREGDFVKLSDTQPTFGPGPLVVLYNVPAGVTNEEIQDMLVDGAPTATQKGNVPLFRVDESNTVDMSENDSQVLDMSMQEALEGIATGKLKDNYKEPLVVGGTNEAFPNVIGQEPPIVVTLFSGFSNDEMLAAYKIIASEIYQEAQLEAACAKAVPNAMEKPLRQVLEEIGGDHRDAMQQSN